MGTAGGADERSGHPGDDIAIVTEEEDACLPQDVAGMEGGRRWRVFGAKALLPNQCKCLFFLCMNSCMYCSFLFLYGKCYFSIKCLLFDF